ncbi:hypothetical protein [Bacillus xiapuensis]|uniref:hypothetical protein n=1 Tax=Bacillus xiapuensis TaxID=2014075 RepID=UPI000C249D21|nr:hypothetical protein [Bacillus xiapuensis]
MKGLRLNEKGVLFPYVLLLFAIICALTVAGTGILISKQRTAANFTGYYEAKVMELLTLAHIHSQLDQGAPLSGSYHTNRGTVIYTAVPKKGSEQIVVQFKTDRETSVFRSSIIYDKSKKQIVKRIE